MATIEVQSQLMLHARITELCESIAAKKMYFRATAVTSVVPEQLSEWESKPHIDRDRMMCALLRKAANTHRSVRILCEAGLSEDAYSLARVLFENMVTLGWILSSEDWIERIDIYAMYIAAVKRRFGDVVAEAYETGHMTVREYKGMVGPGELAIAADIFNDGWSRWARTKGPDGQWQSVSFEKMCDHLNQRGEHGIEYDFLYFDMSAFIHSTAPSLISLLRDKIEIFTCSHVPRNERAPYALISANMFMLLAVAALNERIGLGLDDELHSLWDLLQVA